MSDDDVRRALSAYAAATPDLDPRAGLAGRLAHRQRVRHAAIAGTAIVAAIVAGTGVATLGRDKDTAGIVALDDPTAPPAATESPTAEPTMDPTPSPTATLPSPSPTTAAPTTAPPPPPPPPTSPPPPGSPVVKNAGGSSGLQVRVEIDHGSLPTAANAKLDVTASDDDGQPYVTGVTWGDGSREYISNVVATCPSPMPEDTGSTTGRTP
jgi:hypothetical protein